MIISILEGAVLVDYHPLSLSSSHCDKLKDKLQVTLSPSQSPVALLEKSPGWLPLPFVGEFIAGLVIFSIRMFLEPNFNLQGNYLWSF